MPCPWLICSSGKMRSFSQSQIFGWRVERLELGASQNCRCFITVSIPTVSCVGFAGDGRGLSASPLLLRYYEAKRVWSFSVAAENIGHALMPYFLGWAKPQAWNLEPSSTSSSSSSSPRRPTQNLLVVLIKYHLYQSPIFLQCVLPAAHEPVDDSYKSSPARVPITIVQVAVGHAIVCRTHDRPKNHISPYSNERYFGSDDCCMFPCIIYW